MWAGGAIGCGGAVGRGGGGGGRGTGAMALSLPGLRLGAGGISGVTIRDRVGVGILVGRVGIGVGVGEIVLL